MLARRTAQKRRGYQHGDTLIEVLMAFGVFSLVAVGAIAVMNQGSYLASRTLESAVVRQAMNDQAEAIRFLHYAYIAQYQPGQTYDSNEVSPANEWLKIKTVANKITKATDIADIAAAGKCRALPNGALPNGAFVMDTLNAKTITETARMKEASTYSQLVYEGDNLSSFKEADGIWIEAISSTGSAALGYIDFHIYACWMGQGQSVPITLGTIVRLYEPR